MDEKRCPCGFPKTVCWRCGGYDVLCEKLPDKVQHLPGNPPGVNPQLYQAVLEASDQNRSDSVGRQGGPLRDRLLWATLGLVATGWGIGWILGFIVGRWG